MKKIIFLFCVIFPFIVAAQKSNENDTKIALINPKSHENITFLINTEWFEPNQSQKFAYISKDKKINLWVRDVNYLDFDVALENIKKKYPHNTVVIDANKVIRSMTPNPQPGRDEKALYYGINSTDGRMITIMVSIPAELLPEWLPYFDNLAKSVTIQNN